MGKKYKNPLAEEPAFMKDFIYLLSKHKAVDYKFVLGNCLAHVSRVRANTLTDLKKKILWKFIYFFGTFFFVIGLLDSIREYIR